jgi:imidazoleglycerol-phosphate dehydratase
MGERWTTVERRTAETDVRIRLDLDGAGQHEVVTGIGFLDHMLAHLAVHGLFDLTVQSSGDLEVDEHHTVEDVALCLGQALDGALGDRSGISRTGHAFVPMDETLALVVVDLGGRPYTVVRADFDTAHVGEMGTSLIQHFLETLAMHGRLNLHARVFYGHDDHHKAEALFKALGQALRAAVAIDPRREGIPSTKGTLSG